MIFEPGFHMHRIALGGAALLCACEGQVSIQLSATPPEDLNAAVLQVRGVSLERDDGGREELLLGNERQIDTFTLDRGALTSLFSDKDVTAGDYSGIELLLSAKSQVLDSYLEASNGGETPLRLSTGSRAFASEGFSVRDDKTTRLVLHFDLRSSLLSAADSNGDRVIQPRLRLLEEADAGSISGDVDVQLFSATGCDTSSETGRVMYVFSGHDVSPDDLDGQDAEPLSSALIRAASNQADYVVAALPPGDFTLAASCNANLDDPTTDDPLNFVTQGNVTLTAGSNATLNFTP